MSKFRYLCAFKRYVCELQKRKRFLKSIMIIILLTRIGFNTKFKKYPALPDPLGFRLGKSIFCAMNKEN